MPNIICSPEIEGAVDHTLKVLGFHNGKHVTPLFEATLVFGFGAT
jgi:hypothetical protein